MANAVSNLTTEAQGRQTSQRLAPKSTTASKPATAAGKVVSRHSAAYTVTPYNQLVPGCHRLTSLTRWLGRIRKLETTSRMPSCVDTTALLIGNRSTYIRTSAEIWSAFKDQALMTAWRLPGRKAQHTPLSFRFS